MNGEAFVKTDGDGAYDYIRCDASDASHISAEKKYWNGTDWVWSSTGIQPKQQWEEGILGDYAVGYARNVTYYKKGLPNTPKYDHQYAKLEITPQPGYYVKSVVITCANKGTTENWDYVWDKGALEEVRDATAYGDCNTFKAGDAFHADFNIEDGGKVSLVLDSEDFSHYGSYANRYFIMICTEPIPNPLYLAYDAGIMNDIFDGSGYDWLDHDINPVAGNYKYGERYATQGTWTESDFPNVTVSDIKDEYKRFTNPMNQKVYVFDGWKLERYGSFNENAGYGEDCFQDQYGLSEDKNSGDQFQLRFHTKLVAQWKEVTDQPETYTLNLYKVSGELNGVDPFSTEAPRSGFLNGASFTLYDSETKEAVKSGLAPSKNNTATSMTPATVEELVVGKIYYLVEDQEPESYTKLTNRIYFKLTDRNSGEVWMADENGVEIAGTKQTVSNLYGTLDLTVANYGGAVLPSTGGTGTLMYTLGGGMLMMAAAIALVYKKSLRREGREN